MNLKKSTLFFLTILFLWYGCKKESSNSELKNSDSKQSIIDTFKKGFLKKNYDKRLNQTINDTIVLKWVPDWKSYTSSTLGDTLTYYYIALNPVVLNTKSNSTINNTQEVNLKKFLLIGKSSNRTFYRIATYIFATNDSKTLKDTVRAIGQNYNLNNFTGSILFENLDKNSFSKNYYQNGNKTTNINTLGTTSSGLKPNYFVTECYVNVICTYYTNCNGLYITATSGRDFCPGEPFFIPAGCFSFNGWNYSGTQYNTVCNVVEYPDPPVGGGGSTPPPTNTNPANISLGPPTPSVEPCDGIPLVNSISNNSTISNQNLQIKSATTTNQLEYGAEQNLQSLTGDSYNTTNVRTDSQAGRFTPTFTWNNTDGFTIGVSHGHPGGNAQSPADATWLYTNLGNSQLVTAGDDAIKFYKTHASLTVLTDSVTYIITVNNWVALQAIVQIGNNNPLYYNSSYIQLINYYSINHPGAPQSAASEYALICLYGGALNIYKKAANSSTYVPLVISDDSSGVKIKPC